MVVNSLWRKRRWPWTLDPSASTFQVMGLGTCITVLVLCGIGNGTQGFIYASQAFHHISYISVLLILVPNDAILSLLKYLFVYCIFSLFCKCIFSIHYANIPHFCLCSVCGFPKIFLEHLWINSEFFLSNCKAFIWFSSLLLLASVSSTRLNTSS